MTEVIVLTGREALTLVLELAHQNVLELEQVSGDDMLLLHARKQRRAIEIVSDLLENLNLDPHFDLEQKAYHIHGVANFNEFFDYKQVEWLITDGLGNLAQVTIMLGCNGNVLVRADTIVLDEQGEETSRSGLGKQLFQAERLWR
jgi:hypothetical protein